MKKRDQVVKLKNLETNEIVEARVVLSDSKQGYLAEKRGMDNFREAWKWYSPKEWSEIG